MDPKEIARWVAGILLVGGLFGTAILAVDKLPSSYALIFCALEALVAVVIAAAAVISSIRDSDEPETTKIRFAAATFTGIMMVFVLVACLYFAEPHIDSERAEQTKHVDASQQAGQSKADSDKGQPCCVVDSPGKEIFEKTVAGLFTLAGSIVGYLFGHSGQKRHRPEPPKDERLRKFADIKILVDSGALTAEQGVAERDKVLESS